MDKFFKNKLEQIDTAFANKQFQLLEEHTKADHSNHRDLNGYNEFLAKVFTYKALAKSYEGEKDQEVIEAYNAALFHYSESIKECKDNRKIKELRFNSSGIAYNLSVIYQNLRFEIIDNNNNIDSLSEQIQGHLNNERIKLDIALHYLQGNSKKLNDQEKHRIAIIYYNYGKSYESDNFSPSITESLKNAKKYYTKSLDFINTIQPSYVPAEGALSINETKNEINIALTGINNIISSTPKIHEDHSTASRNCTEEEAIAKLAKYASEFENNGNNLWNHQKECITSISRAFENNTRAGYVKMATGSGKTNIFTSIVSQMSLETIIIAPTNILVGQIHSALKEKSPHLDIGIIDAKQKRKGKNVTVTTYSSFEKIHKMKAFSKTKLIILDEAHSSLSFRRAKAVRYFIEDDEKSISDHSANSNETGSNHSESARKNFQALVLGFTATEEFSGKRNTGDLRSLEELLPTKFFDYPILKGIEDRVLHSCKIVEVKLDERISREIKLNTKKSDVDFTAEQLEILDQPVINRVVTDIIANITDPENGASFFSKKGLVFAISIEHAESIKSEINKVLGDNFARTIHSHLDKKEITETLAMHKRKEVSVLINVDMLTVGYDDQQLEYIIDFRPTKSSVRLLQTFGRLVRKDPGSPDSKTYFQLLIPDMNLQISELMDNRTRLGDIVSSPISGSSSRTEIQIPNHCYYQCVFSNGVNTERALESKKDPLTINYTFKSRKNNKTFINTAKQTSTNNHEATTEFQLADYLTDQDLYNLQLSTESGIPNLDLDLDLTDDFFDIIERNFSGQASSSSSKQNHPNNDFYLHERTEEASSLPSSSSSIGPGILEQTQNNHWRNKVLPKPILNQTYGFENEDAQRRLLSEHSRDSQNSFVSLTMGNGIRPLSPAKMDIVSQDRELGLNSSLKESSNVRKSLEISYSEQASNQPDDQKRKKMKLSSSSSSHTKESSSSNSNEGLWVDKTSKSSNSRYF